MSTSTYDGFDKSAPKIIPSTRGGQAEEDDEVLLAEPPPPPPAHKKRKRVAGEAAEEEDPLAPPEPRGGKVVDESEDELAPRSAGNGEARAEAPRQRVMLPKREKTEARPALGRRVEADSAPPPVPAPSRIESAWDTPPFPSLQEFAKVFVDRTEEMIGRVLDRQAEILRLQQKMCDQLAGTGELNKKDAAFLGVVVLVMVAFALMYFLRG